MTGRGGVTVAFEISGGGGGRARRGRSWRNWARMSVVINGATAVVSASIRRLPPMRQRPLPRVV